MGSESAQGGISMQKTMRIRTTVLPGGKIEIVDQELEPGENVDVTISPATMTSARFAWQIVSEASGQLLFKTAKEVDDYIVEERAS